MAREKHLKYCLCAILGFLILSIIILSCVPPVSRDALIHHLAVPKLYLQHGGIYEIPFMKFSYYPMNLELLYMIPMYFGNDIIPKLIHFAFALATAFIIYRYLKKRLNIVYGLFGGLLFLSTPIIVKLSITVYVDLGLVFFSTASLILLLKWAEENCRLKYLVYSAICCGLALGTKYNGLVVLFLLTLFVPVIYLRRFHEGHKINTNHQNRTFLNQIKAMECGIVFMAIALIIFSPWMTRNFQWKGNPIYPLYHNILKSKVKMKPEENQKGNIISRIKYRLSQNRGTRWNHFSIRRLIYKESWWQILLIPIRIFFQGDDGNPKYFDGKLNPILLILPLFAIIPWKKESSFLKRDVNLLIIFSSFFLLYTFISQDMRIRYIAPILPPLVILSAFGCKRIEVLITEIFPNNYKRLGKYLLPTFVTLFMMMNLFYLIELFKYVEPFDYICGKVSREEYITKFRPEYPVIQYANRNLPADSKILGVFLGNRQYYSDRDMFFDEKLILKSVKSRNDSREVLNTLKRRSVTHMIIWERYFIHWIRSNLNNKELIVLKTFFKDHTKRLYSNGGYTLFQLSYVENKTPLSINMKKNK